MSPLLAINNLSVRFENNLNEAAIVQIKNLCLYKGKLLALVGESGSGKSVTALSILQLLPVKTRIHGEIMFYPEPGKQMNLAALSQKEITAIRGNRIAMIFQEPMTSLNPVLTCGSQVMEAIITHQKISKKNAREKTIALFKQVELPAPAAMLNRYPHQLSGGQKQRVMIAMALSCEPALLIADEPTTALDVRVQQSVLKLIKKIQLQNSLCVLLITHDLGLVADVADEVAVMYKGEIVEQGNTGNILKNPGHDYTKALLSCRPDTQMKGKKLPVLADFLQKKELVPAPTEPLFQPPDYTTIILSVQHLAIQFPSAKNFYGKTTSFFKAVDDVSIDIFKNETVGLVGESGCGKTTLARCIMQLIKPAGGKIFLNGRDISGLDGKELRKERKDLQIVFQDPYGSLNPRLSIGEAIMEPMAVHNLYDNKNGRKEKMAALLELVKLDADHYKRYPHQFSGGQRQRICIARALALEPAFLVFDESVSALDVSVQAQVLNLINELKASFNFTSLFISHDLAVVHYISDRILVMKDGKIIESGTAEQVYHDPKDDYTKKLIDAIPGKINIQITS